MKALASHRNDVISVGADFPGCQLCDCYRLSWNTTLETACAFAESSTALMLHNTSRKHTVRASIRLTFTNKAWTQLLFFLQ